MAFIKDFICRSCESTLGRWGKIEGHDRAQPYCFTCGAGEFELSDLELRGIDHEEAIKKAGREWGHCGDIQARINSPGRSYSAHVTSRSALDAINVKFGMGAVHAVKHEVDLDPSVSKKDIQAVEEGMQKIIKEESCTDTQS